MKKYLEKDWHLWLIIMVPFIYLALIFDSLPNEVPVHWGINGDIDRMGNKLQLIMLPILLPLLVYLILTIAPYIDPKGKLKNMSKKYDTLKLLLTVFMSLLATYFLYTVKNGSLGNPNLIFMLIGILFIILGNYFQTIKANYFIGIRTPWTLENETVWKLTHAFGGKLWFAGGLFIFVAGIVLESALNFKVFIGVTLFIAIVPMIYSYIQYHKINRAEV